MEFQAIDKTTGEMVHIQNATKGQQYLCCVCRSTVFIVRGPVKAPHYRHQDTAIHTRRVSGETRLHNMGKEIIRRYKLVQLPDEHGYAEFENVVAEKTYQQGDITLRPDLTACPLALSACPLSGMLFIEIKVSHAVSKEKQRHLWLFDVNTMEIDLSPFADKRSLSEEELVHLVLFNAPRAYLHKRGDGRRLRWQYRWQQLQQWWREVFRWPRRHRLSVAYDRESGQGGWCF